VSMADRSSDVRVEDKSTVGHIESRFVILGHLTFNVGQGREIFS
jgi:hypothetical protein